MKLYSSIQLGIVLLSVYYSKADGIITIPPVDTQGLINTVSIFYCEGHGDKLQWSIDSGTINNHIKQERGIEVNTTKRNNLTIMSEFRIIAKPINDNIVIGCIIVLSEIVIKGATFQVLGISPVNNLQLNISELLLNTSFITWDPPSFSSDDDYHYNIIIEVNNEYILVDEATQDLEYILEMEPCNLYIINILAVSVSYTSTPEMKQHFCAENKFNITKPLIKFKDTEHCTVTVEVEMYTEFSKLCPGTITGTANSINPFKPDPVDTTSYEFGGTDNNSLKYNFTINDFESRMEGLLTVEFMDDFNINDIISQEVKFTTFHVQELNIIDVSNGLVSVTCVFAEGSSADGCLMGFINEHNESSEHVIYKTLGKDSVTEYITIPNGIYHTVNVYDIVNGTTSDLISIDYTIELTVNISFIHTTTNSYYGTFRTSSHVMSTLSTTTVSSTSTITMYSPSPTLMTDDPATQTNPIVIGMVGVFVLIIILTTILLLFLIRKLSMKKQSFEVRQELMNLRKPQAPPSLYEEVPDRGTQVMPIESSNNEEDPYLMTRDQFLSDGSPPNSGDPLLRGYNDLQIFNSSPTSQESTSATPSMDPHFPRTNRSPPEHKIQVDGATGTSINGLVDDQDLSETSHSIDTPPLTSDENLEHVEVSNDSHNEMTVRCSVVVVLETSKNSKYAELQYPDNPPRVLPSNNTNVIYSEISPQLQEDSPPPYCDLVSDEETVTECSGYAGTNGNLVFTTTNMQVHGPTVAGSFIFNSRDTNNHYHIHPHLASSQEEINIIIMKEKDYVSTETKVQGDRQVYTTIQQQSPELQEDILPFSNTQDNSQSAIIVQHREDLEEDLSDNCQQVDRSSNGQLVITSSTFFIKSSLVVCKSSEQVKEEKDEEPEKEKVDEVFGPKLVCFGHLDQAKEIAETTFFNLLYLRRCF